MSGDARFWCAPTAGRCEAQIPMPGQCGVSNPQLTQCKFKSKPGSRYCGRHQALLPRINFDKDEAARREEAARKAAAK